VSDAPTLAEVIACLDDLFDPRLAASWDAVGLVCGDPDQPVRSVLFAVDPTLAVVDEAVQRGVDLLVTHHPLLLKPVHSVAATTPKGRAVHRLLAHGIALHVCHTNADGADPGVSDAIADALGLADTRPLDPEPPTHPSSSTTASASRGLGRVGVLPRTVSLRAFAEGVAAALPPTAGGVRVSGDPDRDVRVVALCGGAGDGLLDLARHSGADVYLTSDLRHHPASELREHGHDGGEGLDDGLALVDVAHWAAEWMWLPVVAQRLRDTLAGSGTTVDTHVSRIRTDPWRFHVAQETTAESQDASHAVRH
jgi:dinuclear metal center YbgI/SA1388 family protein